MTISKLRPLAGLATAALALTAVTFAGAQQFTSAEQAEINADARSTTQFVERGSSERGTLCQPPQQPVEVYFNDFESGGGGWSATGFGDWENGAVQAGVFDQCDTAGGPEPSGAFSGSNAWATNLDGCYANSGSTNTLSQTFDFSGVQAPIQLTVQHWLHVFGTFDTAEVLVNGDQLFFEDSSTASTSYAPLTLDLSPYAGQASVTVEFNVNATTVVNRAGWYLDDMEIRSCQAGAVTPESVPTLSPMGLALLVLALMLAGGVFVRLRA